MKKKVRVGILGSTGSIGTQALQVIAKHSDLFEVVLLSCKRNLSLLTSQIVLFNPLQVIHGDTTTLNYSETYRNCDIVINGISGLAGLMPTIAVLNSDAKLATANKESIVAYGEKLIQIAKQNKKDIFPLDSEHSAIMQCLETSSNINKIIITASGGPFRGYTVDQLKSVTAEDAIKHPTWKMGLKVTIDSATLMNKGMEIIEAKHLFGFNNIDVLIHRESIVHAIVGFRDGSYKALLYTPNMFLPIQYALTHPKRIESDVKELDLAETGILSFGKPDFEKFPCLDLARSVLTKGDYEGTVLTAADEIAVELFVKNNIKFYDIPAVIEKSLNVFSTGQVNSVEEVIGLADEVKDFILRDYKNIITI